MPISRTAPARSSIEDALFTSRIVLQHEQHKVLIKFYPDMKALGLYQYLKVQAVELLSDVGDDSFWTSELLGFEGEEVEISEAAMPGLEKVIRRLIVKVRPDARKLVQVHQCSRPAGVEAGPREIASLTSEKESLQITVGVYNSYTKERVEIRCAPDTSSGISCDDQLWTYEGKEVLASDTLSGLRVRNNDTLRMEENMGFDKPVIYLYPPTAMRISTTLSLVHGWKFSAIYPVVPARTIETGQELKWVVDAEPSGTLTEVGTGLEVSYLYWKAKTRPKELVSPPLSPSPVDGAHFTPNQASMDSKDTVLLAVAKITPYLDGALKALGLHVEARTSFITFWLPSLLKYEYVALRFLPQSLYERAAPLTVEPVPDVVARIFMLFKGVKANELAVWSEARELASEDVGRWTDVVGVDLKKVRDAGLFRVIEWGGMEVFN